MKPFLGCDSQEVCKVLYMSSRFWLLGVESRDFSHVEKERTACKAKQIHKMTTIFTENDPTHYLQLKLLSGKNARTWDSMDFT